MRNAFAQELLSLATSNDKVVMLSGDIGNRLFDDFKLQHPERFFNCGVAEANMMGVAAGLAMSGLRPIAYTITPFVTTRCLEQIRVDVCYHHVPVVIVGVGAGLSYAGLGATHHACEDLAFLRVLPHMKVVCPADPLETRLALRASLDQSDPVYIRLGKKGEPLIHASPPLFEIGKAIQLRFGTDLAIVTTGTIVPQVLSAANVLAERGIEARVIHMHTVKPLDEFCLAEVFDAFKLVISIEEHSVLGGLGGALAEWMSNRSKRARLVRFGTPDAFLHEAGGQSYARRRVGLDADSLAQRIQGLWDKG